MKDVARVDVEPFHIGIGTITWHHAKTCGVVIVPVNRELTAHCHFKVEHCRQVHENDVVLGDIEVVHHGGPAHSDDSVLHHFTSWRNTQVGEVWLKKVVPKSKHFASEWADLGVSSKGASEFAVVVRWPNRVQVAIEFVRKVSFFKSKKFSGVTKDVRVGF